MTDEQANVVLAGLLDLAVAVRDEGPRAVQRAAQRVLDAAHGDPVAALTIAAALIRVDQPVDAWWQKGLAGVGAPDPEGLAPCGTHAAFVRHKDRGEPIDDACREANRVYDREQRRLQRDRKRQATAA